MKSKKYKCSSRELTEMVYFLKSHKDSKVKNAATMIMALDDDLTRLRKTNAYYDKFTLCCI